MHITAWVLIQYTTQKKCEPSQVKKKRHFHLTAIFPQGKSYHLPPTIQALSLLIQSHQRNSQGLFETEDLVNQPG